MHNVLVEFFTGPIFIFFSYSSIEKGMIVSVFIYFCFLPISQFSFFTSTKSSWFGGKYLCRPSSNMGSINLKTSSIVFFILSNNTFENIIKILSFQHLAIKNCSSMANRIVRVHKLGNQNREQPDMTTNLITVPVSLSFFTTQMKKHWYDT